MKHHIVKRLHFSYGHRLMDYDGKCAHAHGHNGVLEVELGSEKLDHRGMVYDFSDVKKRLKEFYRSRTGSPNVAAGRRPDGGGTGRYW